MKSVVVVSAFLSVVVDTAAMRAFAGASPGPTAITTAGAISVPRDRPYPGEIRVSVDASDLERRIVRVHESLSGVRAETVLLYPQWLPGNHSPQGPIDRLAGLRITANGAVVPWTRDPADVYAFRVQAAPGVRSIDIEFEYLSPTSPKVGSLEMSTDLLSLEWNAVVLYPAGYFARRIPVEASLTLPQNWKLASALERAPASTGVSAGTDAAAVAGTVDRATAGSATGAAQTTFKRVSLETLIDSPVYAGRYAAQLDLDPGGAVPVHLNLFADRPELLAVKPEQLEAYRALVRQAYKLFGSPHYAHYDFLYSLSNQIAQKGLEHHQSSEDGGDPDSFTAWDQAADTGDLLPHEFTHSWNGKFRRPADLWTPNYNVPMQDSLLWVYEGQTQYWGHVLAARAGLRTAQQTLDQFALTAAYYEHESGRAWRSLQDTTDDPIINPRRPMSWRDWQRFEEYYSEGSLIWLDADTLIRERTQGRRSLDDFARAFFGIDDGSLTTVTYTFDEVVKTLNAVEPYDWAGFLHQRIDSTATPAPLEGLRRGGYKLVYTDSPSAYQKARDDRRKHVSLLYSIGVDIDSADGVITDVMRDSAAFRANLTEGAQILAINGAAYSADILKDAIRSAAGTKLPFELIIKTGDRFRVVRFDYHDGLRYPHLERDSSEHARLDDIMAARD